MVSSVTEQQQYQVVYGSAQILDQTSVILDGNSDTSLTNQQYSVQLSGLEISTTYYFRVSATFSGMTISTEVNEFRTLDPRKNIVESTSQYTKPHSISVQLQRSHLRTL